MVSTPRISIGPAGCRINRDCAALSEALSQAQRLSLPCRSRGPRAIHTHTHTHTHDTMFEVRTLPKGIRCLFRKRTINSMIITRTSRGRWGEAPGAGLIIDAIKVRKRNSNVNALAPGRSFPTRLSQRGNKKKGRPGERGKCARACLSYAPTHHTHSHTCTCTHADGLADSTRGRRCTRGNRQERTRRQDAQARAHEGSQAQAQSQPRRSRRHR